jgi:hypothetical protein
MVIERTSYDTIFKASLAKLLGIFSPSLHREGYFSAALKSLFSESKICARLVVRLGVQRLVQENISVGAKHDRSEYEI